MASDSSHQHDTASESRPTFAMRAVMSSIRMTFPKVPQLSCATLAEWLEGKQQPSESIVLLDVRDESEFSVSHLGGAQHIDGSVEDGDLAAILDTLKSKHSDASQPLKIVCYCSVGYRSAKLATRLLSLMEMSAPEVATSRVPGRRVSNADDSHEQSAACPAAPAVEVYNLEGSLFQWANESRRMVDQDNACTEYVHPYNAVWGRLVDKQKQRS